MELPTKNVNVTLKDAKPLLCKCGGRDFLQLVRFFRFSALLTGSPKDTIAPIEVFTCGKCGEALQELLPIELRDVAPPKLDLDFSALK